MTKNDTPIQLKPIYRTTLPNEPLGIYSGPLTVESEGTIYSGVGRVDLEWLPSPAVRWHLSDCQPAIWGLPDGVVFLKVPGIPNAIRARWTQSSMSSTAGAKPSSASGCVENGEGRACGAPLKSVTFHLANFIPYIGKPATLRESGWRITLDGIASDATSESRQNARGSFVISHVGRLEREDGELFSPEDAKSLLDNLYWFFSFCRGRATPAILPVGLNENGEEVWSEWGSWHMSPARVGRNWYNDFSAEGLEGVFPGFMRRCSEALWSDSAKLAIYWYLEAENLGNDSALVLLQAALELVAWTFLVEDRHLLTPSKFKKLDTATNIRQLLEAQAIPTSIAASLEVLAKLATEPPSTDGPHALVRLRNALVHSTLKNQNKIKDVSARAFFEASSLSLWYLEMLLLRLFDYKGKYSNRLILSGWRGQEVEPVPWARE